MAFLRPAPLLVLQDSVSKLRKDLGRDGGQNEFRKWSANSEDIKQGKTMQSSEMKAFVHDSFERNQNNKLWPFSNPFLKFLVHLHVLNCWFCCYLKWKVSSSCCVSPISSPLPLWLICKDSVPWQMLHFRVLRPHLNIYQSITYHIVAAASVVGRRFSSKFVFFTCNNLIVGQ